MSLNEPAVQAILTKIRAADLEDGFTTRDVHQFHWSGLTDREQVQAGLNLLVELSTASWEPGGRPTTTYVFNPRGWHNHYQVT